MKKKLLNLRHPHATMPMPTAHCSLAVMNTALGYRSEKLEKGNEKGTACKHSPRSALGVYRVREETLHHVLNTAASKKCSTSCSIR